MMGLYTWSDVDWYDKRKEFVKLKVQSHWNFGAFFTKDPQADLEYLT